MQWVVMTLNEFPPDYDWLLCHGDRWWLWFACEFLW